MTMPAAGERRGEGRSETCALLAVIFVSCLILISLPVVVAGIVLLVTHDQRSVTYREIALFENNALTTGGQCGAIQNFILNC